MAPPADAQPECLIIGCGYLGRRVAARWTAAGRAVAALTRRNADTLRNLGVAPVVGDVLDPASLRGLPAAGTVLYTVGMGRGSGRSMREVSLDGLRHVLDTLPAPRRFVYVSSTGVYGQTDGSWVDESSPTEPTEESGRVVLDAERLLREKLPAAVVLRFAGIYGPGRLLRRQSLLKGEPLAGDPAKWLNLIHVDDGAGAVLAAEAHAAPGETYNVADDEPVSRRGFYTLLAELLYAPPARFEPCDEPAASNRAGGAYSSSASSV
jgi:nucleoside-diphosphate-sugar epimerase